MHPTGVPKDAEAGAAAHASDSESADEHEHKRSIGVLGVVGFAFFCVAGGPLGSEPIVSSGGPIVAFFALLIYPLIWSIPVSLVVARLAVAFPADGGYVIWVAMAFGSFWAFQGGYWSWLGGVVDTALYPTLSVDIATQLWGQLAPLTAWLTKAAFTTLVVAAMLPGISWVGRGLGVLTAFVLLPYAVLCVAAAPQVDPAHWLEYRTANASLVGVLGSAADLPVHAGAAASSAAAASAPFAPQWGRLANSVYWNWSGMQSVATFAGEVKDPARTYPRALAIAMTLVGLCYAVPLAAASGVNRPHWSTWQDGSFSAVAAAAAGPWLGAWIVGTSIVGNVAMMSSELLADAFQLYGMARMGLAPRFFAHLTPRGLPLRALLAAYAIVLSLLTFDFEAIIILDNALNALSTALALLAAAKLLDPSGHARRASASYSAAPPGPALLDHDSEALRQAALAHGREFAPDPAASASASAAAARAPSPVFAPGDDDPGARAARGPCGALLLRPLVVAAAACLAALSTCARAARANGCSARLLFRSRVAYFGSLALPVTFAIYIVVSLVFESWTAAAGVGGALVLGIALYAALDKSRLAPEGPASPAPEPEGVLAAEHDVSNLVADRTRWLVGDEVAPGHPIEHEHEHERSGGDGADGDSDGDGDGGDDDRSSGSGRGTDLASSGSEGSGSRRRRRRRRRRGLRRLDRASSPHSFAESYSDWLRYLNGRARPSPSRSGPRSGGPRSIEMQSPTRGAPSPAFGDAPFRPPPAAGAPRRAGAPGMALGPRAATDGLVPPRVRRPLARDGDLRRAGLDSPAGAPPSSPESELGSEGTEDS